jgi:multifunctional beta-oxidation protein
MSAMGGFKVPILHGLCTFGYAGRHILKAYCGNDASKFKNIKVRFAGHVFPGETLETRMWKEGSRVVFQVRVVERDTIAISNACVELSGDVVSPSAGPSVGGAGDVKFDGFAASAVFAGVQASLADDASRKAQIKKAWM